MSDSTETIEIPRLKAKYNDEIRDQLQAALGLGNVMEVPRLEKIVVNMGVGGAVGQASLLEHAVDRPDPDHRPEAADHPGPQVHRQLQAP